MKLSPRCSRKFLYFSQGNFSKAHKWFKAKIFAKCENVNISFRPTSPTHPLMQWGPICTDKKENQIFLIYKEIQNGAVAKLYMTNSLLIYGEIFLHILIYYEALPYTYDFATASLWISLNMRKIWFSFLSVCNPQCCELFRGSSNSGPPYKRADHSAKLRLNRITGVKRSTVHELVIQNLEIYSAPLKFKAI